MKSPANTGKTARNAGLEGGTVYNTELSLNMTKLDFTYKNFSVTANLSAVNLKMQN